MQITVWTTAQCNLKCSYCYENKNDMAEKRMPILDEEKTVEYVISKLASDNVILFHGGEPLLNFPFIRRMTEAVLRKDDKCRFGLTTNGTIWTEEMEEFFKGNKESFEDWISISIDGQPMYHNLSRRYKSGEETFHIVAQTSDRIRKIFPDIRVRMTVTPLNSRGLADNIDFLVGLGFRKIVPVLDVYDKTWTDKDFEGLSMEIDKVIEKYKSRQEISVGLLEECRYLRKRGFCTFSSNIYVDGRIYPCTYAVGDERFLIGDIWSGIDEEKEKKLMSLVNQNNPECVGCTNLDYCIYNRCKFLNYAVEGGFDIPCEIGCAYENLKVEKIKKCLMG